ncbi:FAD-binding protein, partial [Streptomyces sp. DT225]
MTLPNRRTLLAAGAAVLTATTATACEGTDTTDPAPGDTRPPNGPSGPADWSALAKSLDGPLIRPGDTAYPTARQLYNTRFDDRKPAGIAYVRHEDDVRECLAFARRTSVPVAIRSGGHSYAGWSSGDGRLVIDVASLDRVEGDGTIGA